MSSYDRHIERIAPGHYRLSWRVDFHYADSRLRYPRSFSRDTDQKGAERFARRWSVEMPATPAADRGQGVGDD